MRQLGLISLQQVDKCPGIHGDLIGSGNNDIPRLYVCRVSTSGAVTHKDPGTIKYGEGWFDHDRKIGDNGVNILMKLVTLTSQ